MPFEEADAPYFFGRENERAIIKNNLIAWRLTLLYGVTGVGKSSVLHAGVEHDLNEEARIDTAKSISPEFKLVVVRSWREAPLLTLEREVCKALDIHESHEIPLKTFPEKVATWGKRVRGKLLIVLDQFEEYFLYHPNEDKEGTFAVEFPRLVNQKGIPANFLISIRADCLAYLDRFKGAIPGLFENRLRLERLSLSAARASIYEPITKYNRERAGDPEISIEPELVEKVVEEVETGRVVLGETGRGTVQRKGGSQAGEKRIETSFLQLVMTRLWDEEISSGSRRLRMETFSKLGGAKKIVRDHVDDAMNELSLPEKNIARAAFFHLVTPSNITIAHTVPDLSSYVRTPKERLEPVLEKLSGKRILRPNTAADGELSYKVFHDVLAPAVLEQSREAAAAAKQKRKDKRQRIAWIFSTSLVCLIGIVGMLYERWIESERRLNIEVARYTAAQADLLRNYRASALNTSTLLAVESMRRAPIFENDQALRRSLDILRKPLLLQHGASVGAVVFSQDGRWIATGSRDKTARIFETATGKEIAILPHRKAVVAIAFSPDGDHVATASLDGVARVFETISGKEVAGLQHRDAVMAVIFSPDGSHVATGSLDGTARVFESTSGKEIARLIHGGAVLAVAFSPDGRRIVTGSYDATARIFEAATGKELARLMHKGWVAAVAFSPNGHLLATGGLDQTARVFETATGREIAHLSQQGSVVDVTFSGDSRLVATASVDKTARVFEAASGRELAHLIHQGWVSAAAFSPDSRRLVTGSADNTARVFDVASSVEVARFTSPKAIRAVAFSSDGHSVVVGGEDGNAAIFDAARSSNIANLHHTEGVVAAAFSLNGRTVATGSADVRNQIFIAQVFDAATAKPRANLRYPNQILAIATSPDGSRLAIGSDDKTLRVLDIAAGKELWHVIVHGKVGTVTFSPDGLWLAEGSDDNEARVFEVTSSREVARFMHKAIVRAVAFSSDGRWLATGSQDKTARVGEVLIHEVLSGKELLRVNRPALAVALSWDGRWLATGGQDTIARVFDVTKRNEVWHLDVHGEVRTVAFSPDSHWLATGSLGQDVEIFDVVSGMQVTRISGEGATQALNFMQEGAVLQRAASMAENVVSIEQHLLHAKDLIGEACSKLTHNLTPEEWKQYLGDKPYRKTCPNLP